MEKHPSKPTLYITRESERASAYLLSTVDVHIISNETAFAKTLKKAYPKRIFLIAGEKLYDTHELLNHPNTQIIIKQFIDPSILVFKNTPLIEKWCEENKYSLLNPSSKTAASIEEKLTQLQTLKDLLELMPRYEKKTIGEIGWFGTPFILQFNHSHTGSGTIRIDSEKTLQKLKEKFPKRDARIAPFITGPIFTSNIVVGKNQTIRGNISYQITGISPFTDLQFATIGNDWGAPYRILNESERSAYDSMAEEVADTLRKLEWKGLFGIDAIWSTEEKRWYLIEINARQPASATYESELQYAIKNNDEGITILEAHLKALYDEPLNEYTLIKISDGAQIIQRVTEKITSIEQLKTAREKLKAENLHTIPYENTAYNSDLLRIQSNQSIIETEGKFTNIGEKIKSHLT